MKIPARKKVWLVWALSDSGQLFLRAICTTESCAKHYELTAKKMRGTWRVIVSWEMTNHLYASGFDLNEKRMSRTEWNAEQMERPK